MQPYEIKPVIYTRKSSDEDYRQILSIEGQKDEMAMLSSRFGIPVGDIFEESQTAYKSGRPVFNRMIEDIRAGKYNVLLCWKLDRLARNFEDSWKVIDLLLAGKLKEIRTPQRVFLPSDNVIIIAVEFASACQYSRDISVNVKRTNRKKLRDGVWPGRAPFGYINDPVTRDIKIDPVTAPLVRRGFELYATGQYSLEQLRLKLADPRIVEWRKSFRRKKNRQRPLCLTDTLSTSQWHRILSFKFYIGVMEYGGEIQPGKHPPLVSTKMFDRVQILLQKKSARKGYCYKPFAFRRLLQCGTCGCTITMEIQKGICYWRCTKRKGFCPERYTPASKALPQLRELLGRLVPAPEVLALLQNVAEAEKENQEKARQREAALLKKEIEELSSKKRSLLELLLKGTVSENEFRTMSNELTLKESAKTGNLERIEASKRNRFELEDEFISLLSEALVLGKGPEEEDLRTFLEKTGSNYFLTNGQVVVSLEKRWEIWTEWKSQLPTDFLQNPIGYQLAVVRTLWNAVRMAKNGRC